MEYNPQKIEKKWQERWERERIYRIDLDKTKKPFYNLMMFPYPSAEGLHVGNMYAFVHSDAYGRYMRMKGYDVFEPIGLDGFGIHSENYAIKIKEPITEVSKRTEKRFYEQLRMIGNQYDFERTVETYKPEYYKWTQWIFIQMFKHGLAYRKEAFVNWCPSCKTVLADEQVISGRCERCDSVVEKKKMAQWFFKITAYAERLLKNLEHLNWTEKTKIAQKNWIGKSEGAIVKFKILTPQSSKKEETINVFTTRPDTLFGVTYFVLAPEHPLVEKITTPQQTKEVKKYIEAALKKSEIERTNVEKEKTGVFTGAFAINPVNNKKIPVWVADYVLMEYGTGAIMAVPAHDQRDWEFAKKYKLEIIEVVRGKEELKNKAYVEEGININSDFLNGLPTKEAKERMIKYLEEKKLGKRAVHYRLRDWCVSRQRYWGPPIPMVFCERCDWQPVKEKDLPVLLPKTDDYLPRGDGLSPLARNKDFVNTTCPKCKGKAKRETDVSDTFLDSAWYFFRYPSVEFNNKIFDKKRTKKWLPVDMYIGGHEHAVLHLLYSRFITMFFKDIGLIDFEEPYKRFFAHGLVICEGAKMSKSKGNVVNPDDYIKKYGADAVRMYLMFMGDVRQGGDWRETGMAGMFRFVKKIWQLFTKEKKDGKGLKNLAFLEKTIKKVEEDFKRLSFNTAIAKIMELINWYKENENNFSKKQHKEYFEKLSLIITPFAPHIAEEMWERLGHKESITKQPWPKYNENLVQEEKITLIIQINGKLRDKIEIEKNLPQKEIEALTLKREKVKKYLAGKKIRKIIFVKNRLINIVL